MKYRLTQSFTPAFTQTLKAKRTGLYKTQKENTKITLVLGLCYSEDIFHLSPLPGISSQCVKPNVNVRFTFSQNSV